MTSRELEARAAFARDGFVVEAVGPRTLKLSGEIAMREPTASIGPHLRALHEAALGGGELVVDVTELKYVNSSGLRVFLDWLGWLAATPAESRYLVRFVTSARSTWQAASFPAIVTLSDGLFSFAAV